MSSAVSGHGSCPGVPCLLRFSRSSYRGGRCGPAVTGAVQPMLPQRLPIRLRPGPSRRPSSACAAARPGPTAGRYTRRSGFHGDRERRQPPRVARRHGTSMTIHATGETRPYRRISAIPGGCGCFRPGGSRGLCARLAHQVKKLPEVFCTSAGSALPCQGPTPPARSQQRLPTLPGPLPRPEAQCPAPAAAWVTTGRQRTPIRTSARACPVQKEIRVHR